MIRNRFAILEMLEHEAKYALAFLLLTFIGIVVVSLFFRVFSVGLIIFSSLLTLMVAMIWAFAKLSLELVPSPDTKEVEE